VEEMAQEKQHDRSQYLMHCPSMERLIQSFGRIQLKIP
jgi:hypothetical protein